MGVDAVEPDVGGDRGRCAHRAARERDLGHDRCGRAPEFADRKTTKRVDGQALTGWFSEDFTWNPSCPGLRIRERLPEVRTSSASFDGAQPILRLRDVLDIVRDGSAEHGREIGVVLEVKHATYFASIGLDLAPLIDRELREAGWAEGKLPLVIECFESTVLGRRREISASYIYLIEASGRPYDLLTAEGSHALTYKATVKAQGARRPRRARRRHQREQKIALDRGNTIVADAHARGLQGIHLDVPPGERLPRGGVPRPGRTRRLRRLRGGESSPARASTACSSIIRIWASPSSRRLTCARAQSAWSPLRACGRRRPLRSGDDLLAERHEETGTILKSAMPIGMPMIVMHSRMPETMWPIAGTTPRGSPTARCRGTTRRPRSAC